MSDSVLSGRAASGSWSRNAALRIEYTAGVLEEIRRSIQEGFHKIPHGGVETGGLLYGKWDGAVLTISAWRPIQCEHPLGPRFQLSREDEKELEIQLAEPVPELEDCQPVGWFASHSRGALQLRGPDVELHAKYFPEPWQPILLLCASRSQPMRGAFYSRVEGTLVAGAEVASFDVIPNPTAVPRRERRAPQAGPRTDGIPERRDPRRERRRPEGQQDDATQLLASRVGPLPAGEPPPNVAGPELVEHGYGSWSPIDPAVAQGPWLSRGYERVEDGQGDTIHGDPMLETGESAHIDSEPADVFGGFLADGEPAPKFLGPALSERVFPWKRLAWAAMWLAIAGVGVYTIPRLSAPVKPGVVLQAREVAGPARGQLTIHWNLNGSGTLAVSSGELVVVDGARERRFPLSLREINGGSMTYWRQSKQVDVRLALKSADGQSVDGTTRFMGSEPVVRVADKGPDIIRLKNTLQEARRQGRKLERLIALQERKSRAR